VAQFQTLCRYLRHSKGTEKNNEDFCQFFLFEGGDSKSDHDNGKIITLSRRPQSPFDAKFTLHSILHC